MTVSIKKGHVFCSEYRLHFNCMFLSRKINTSPCGTEWHQLIPVGFVIKQNLRQQTNQKPQPVPGTASHSQRKG